MAEMKEHSYLFSLQGLHEMQADRERGEKLRRQQAERRAAEEKRAAAQRAERAEAERLRQQRDERRRCDAARDAAVAAAQVRQRLESEVRRERELMEATHLHEQVLSAHRRDRRILRLQGALTGAVVLMSIGGVGSALAVQAERQEKEDTVAERDRDMQLGANTLGDVQSRLRRSVNENEQLRRRVRELEAVKPTEPKRTPALAVRERPATGRHSDTRPPLEKAPCVGDANDPMNPCLP